MKLLESLIYALIVFTGLYILIAVGIRVFDLMTTFYAHVTAGVVATIVGVLIFIIILIKKK